MKAHATALASTAGGGRAATTIVTVQIKYFEKICQQVGQNLYAHIPFFCL
jgi:hypothetical protein